MKKIIAVLAALIAVVFSSQAKTIKVLAIGNSFSVDGVNEHLSQIGQAAGVDFEILNMYIGGCSLQRHYKNIVNNAAAYTGYHIVNGKMTEYANYSLQEALSLHEWDFVTLQQQSGISGDYETFQPYLHEIMLYLKEQAPGAKILWHQTWAYAKDSNHQDFPRYDRDQMKMYQSIINACRVAMKAEKIRKVIPSGTAIQNARAMEVFGDTMNRDGYHLARPQGRYTAACTWFEVLTGKSVLGNTYMPKEMSPEKVIAAQAAAHAAVKHPYKVSVK